MMPRVTSSVFLDQFIWMMTLGLLLGVAFPPFMVMIGIEEEKVISLTFYTISIFTGLLMGVMNFGLVYFVTRPHLRELSQRMDHVRKLVSRQSSLQSWDECVHSVCQLAVVSSDEFGQSAMSFNRLTDALFKAHEIELAFGEFSRVLSGTLDIKDLGATTLKLIFDHTAYSAGAILLVEDGHLQLLKEDGLVSAKTLADNPNLLEVLERGRPLDLVLPQGVLMDAVVTIFTPRSVYILPIQFRSNRIGVMVLATSCEVTDHCRTLVNLVQDGIALAFNNALAHSKIQEIAALDGLTGFFNRRFGMQRLKEEFKNAARGEVPISVVLIDIDHFKSINDIYGHLIGDRALKEVSAALKRILREGDVTLRYGGEEFLVVLTGASHLNALDTAERLRLSVRDRLMIHQGQQINLSVSLGVSTWPDLSCVDEMELVQYADEALYEAKRSGRNKVVSAHAMVGNQHKPLGR